MAVCAIPTCVAKAIKGLDVCWAHKSAALAKSVHVVGHCCVRCKRRFKQDDYVERFSQRETGARAHVHCEPRTDRPTKRQMREAPKPLFDLGC